MPVISMISQGAPEVEINLPAAEYIRRTQFTRYHATFDIYPGKFYPLECISITPKANANQLYSMRLRIVQDGKPSPSPGMNTMVTVFAVQVICILCQCQAGLFCKRMERQQSLFMTRRKER